MTASDRWPCSQCPKTFTRKGDLVRHNLLHQGHRPHTCTKCGKSFAQYSGYRTHLNVHSGEKPFRCGIASCKATFADPSSRSRHRKETHELSGAYCCPVPGCRSRGIKRRSVFAAHMKKHGSKYEDDDIERHFKNVVRSVRSVKTKMEAPEYDLDLKLPEVPAIMPYDTYIAYNPFPLYSVPPLPNDLTDLHVTNGELFTFDSPSSSLSPDSHSSPSSSFSPSSSPFQSRDRDESRFNLRHVNVAEANGSYDPLTSGNDKPALSPVSQLMYEYGL
ncbi:Sex-determining transformer protein 1 [Favolaschia claudopus]|uniref:Sex-determining transformer protein 1 n=1 Tax=Favolaschia claudopus TaxID=2862362 RepID=A0AAW0DT77_9AGAR